MAQPRVLVTGATGFIGRWAVAALLRRGFEVHSVSSGRQDTPQQVHATDAECHTCDLLDPLALDSLISEVRASYLLHLAWIATPPIYWSAPENFTWVATSLRLLERFRAHGGTRAVVAGTCAEYDWSVAGLCNESETPSVLSASMAPRPYALCKAALQRLSASFSLSSGLSLAWGRIFFQYGPFEHPSRLVPSVIQKLLKRETVDCTHGRQVRDFLYVGDLGDAFAAIVTSAAEGVINIGSGNQVTIADIVLACADQFGRRDLIRLGALPADPSEPALLIPDTNRLNCEVDWRPRVDLASGIEKTVTWWRDNERKS